MWFSHEERMDEKRLTKKVYKSDVNGVGKLVEQRLLVSRAAIG